MKKLALLFICFVSLTSCNVNHGLKNVAIPDRVSHIEFWNGGAKIYEADNASVKILKVTQTALVGTNEYWLKYTVKADGKEVNIIDSESLAISFIE